MGEHVTQAAVDRTMARLGELHATMPADEQAVLETILRQAGGESDEVQGFMPSTNDSRFIKITANTAAGADPFAFGAILQPPSLGKFEGGDIEAAVDTLPM